MKLEPDAGLMDSVNLLYLACNYLVQEALAAGEGDMKAFTELVEVISQPYTKRAGAEQTPFDKYAEPPPKSFGRYVTLCGT